MLKLILSLITCNLILFYFYSIALEFEKISKFKISEIGKIIVGYSIFIIFSYYIYFSLNLDTFIINLFLIILLIFSFKNLKKYRNFFFSKKNIILNLIIIIILLPALVYGEQFIIFRGNYWDSSSYLISGLLFKNYSYSDVLNENFLLIYNEFDNLKRITTTRPLTHYLLSFFLNLKLNIFYAYYLFKCFISLIIFLSLNKLIKKYFNLSSNNIFLLSFIFIFSFWNIYIFEIDALSHYASIPILIYLINLFFALNEKEKLKENYLLISIISAALFIIYPEIFILPVIIYFVIFTSKLGSMSKKEIKYSLFSGVIFLIITLPTLTTNYEYLFVSQLNQSLRVNDWWGYFGSFILGKENLVLSNEFVEKLQEFIRFNSGYDILKFIHNSHFSEKYYFIYLNILPSLAGLYFLLPGQIENEIELIFYSIILITLILYLTNIIFKNLNYILFTKKKQNKILIYVTIIFLVFLSYFFYNSNYWSIIKFYTYTFPFLFIFFAIDFKSNKTNVLYVFLISLFCLYKFSVFNSGIGKYDSFPSILNPSLKKEIIWESINYNDLKKCKKINFDENNYIINAYLNLKLMNVTKSSKDLRVCKLTLEQNKFKFINE